MRKLYQIIASHLNALENCRETDNTEWERKHEDMVARLVADYMPSGSGFDGGTTLDFEASKGGEKLVFHTSFHHMNEGGCYDDWTAHTVTIRPCLIHSISLKVTGRDRNDIKDYIAEAFHSALSTELDNAAAYYKLATSK